MINLESSSQTSSVEIGKLKSFKTNPFSIVMFLNRSVCQKIEPFGSKHIHIYIYLYIHIFMYIFVCLFLQVDDKNHHAKLGSKWKHILHPSTWRGHLTLSACEDLGRTFPALPPLRRAEDQDVLIFLGGSEPFQLYLESHDVPYF